MELEILHQTNIGFIYDVCQVIICKTTKQENWINVFLTNGREETDSAFIEKTLSLFNKVDASWKIFTVKDSQKGTLLSRIYVDFLRDHLYEWTEDEFINCVFKFDNIKNSICNWYFESEELSDADVYISLSNREDLDDIIKLKLFEFFTTREVYVQKLITSIKEVIHEMKDYYALNEVKICQVKSDFCLWKLQQEKEEFASNMQWIQSVKQCIVSFSLISRYVGMRDINSKDHIGWIILGVDYDIDIWKSEKPMDLQGFGRALDDKMRLNVLREIHKNGDKTLTELCERFKVVNAVMLYHLDILVEQRLLFRRKEGRLVYYWLNYGQINQAISALKTEFGR